ncbi:forkhead box Q2 [Thunnus maccoyii]|uniref:forkhead box Q2 n=1 Tax=Thunnus maccoyii TaxID=8240 RepID=UPI001C4B1307|nr:forkhead box Q2 [Thunnus maccoyii]XP_042272966.1 forkhead box Q2 [Thunnus maccoyii]
MSLRYFSSEMTMENRSSCNGSRERLGLSFTIDYLLFNKGVKGSKEEPTGSRMEERTANNMLNHQNPEPKEEGILCEVQEKRLQRSEAETGERKVKEEEGDEEQQEEGEEKMTTAATTTTTSTSGSPSKSTDKPNQSYIALISKAILASEQKKLLLCDIYQWIMDHYPYFKSKDKNWRNSVRHNLSLNDCFIKAGRSENGKGHFWAIHPSNYQDFSNGDYHCRRTRRRVRRVAGQLPLSPLSSAFHHALARPHRTTCWCCPQAQTFPLSCLAPRLYWPWSSVQAQVGLHPRIHASVP